METCMLGRMQLDNEKIVLMEFFVVLIVCISLTISKTGPIIRLRSMLHQVLSSLRLVVLVKNAPNLLLSPTTSEKGTWS